MNKQHDYSDIESIWKGTQLDVRTYSADTPPTPNNICHNSNIIANNPQEDSISSNSQRPNKLIKMIYLPINKLDKNKTRRLIKSTKRYKYLVNHKLSLISQQIKKHMTKECKNIDHKSTTDENISTTTNSIDNIHEKKEDNRKITFGDQIC